ncbi:MAG: hypothetical protein MK078_11600 [Crocinitomicaceae bacterium]|nr:hypothetical protein [Crocinitomicaceae bacterium]
MHRIFFIIFLYSSIGLSQSPNYNDSLVTINGTVLDTTASISFFDMVVIDKTTGKGIFGDYSGKFTIQVKKGDLVGVSVVGYEGQTFTYKDSSYKPVYNITLYLQTRMVVGNEVVVKPLKTLEQLKEERENIVKREVPTISGVSALQSPITALYMAFSKREKTKRMVAELEYKEDQDKVVKEILRVYVNADIIDLDSDEYEEFITFLNLNPEFLKTASDYELIVFIQEKFEHYRRIQEGF